MLQEIIWAIKNQDIRQDDVPPDIYQAISNMNIGSAAEFTAYPEGSPRHPSWPAMHSAASNISFWLRVMFKLSPQQECEAMKVDYAVSFARTLAGVHYPTDNIAGLNMGQEIVARALPEYFNRRYDSAFIDVQNKVEQQKFRWESFDPQNPCPNMSMA